MRRVSLELLALVKVIFSRGSFNLRVRRFSCGFTSSFSCKCVPHRPSYDTWATSGLSAVMSWFGQLVFIHGT